MDKKSRRHYFHPVELVLWGTGSAAIIFSYWGFGASNWLALIASLIGVSSLILSAKGNPIGQLLIVIFSILYGIMSFEAHYYGEMLTYVGMTLPMAVVSCISWIRHPSPAGHSEVRIRTLRPRETVIILALVCAVSAVFYPILAAFHTANLIPSTLSVATSFLAVCLTARRSALYALAYAANDVVLIVLWILAAGEDGSAYSMVICFAVFLINDIYGFINWRRMQVAQTELEAKRHRHVP